MSPNLTDYRSTLPRVMSWCPHILRPKPLHLRLNKRLSKQSWGWWFETLSCPLWHHCNGTEFFIKCRIRLKYYLWDGCHAHNLHEGVIKFNDLSQLADTEVHVVHISHALCIISKLRVNLNWSYSQFASKSVISSPVWRWNLMEDLEKQ